jgi:RNA polymerase sigma factor (sigma-70 family)
MASADLGRHFEEHRGFLWSLCYRLTGDAADADDVVQDTFVRALQHPPPRTEEPWRPWLVRVAVNLARDLLRRRRRRRYEGPWLPSPVETDSAAADIETAPVEGHGSGGGAVEDPASRYDRLESITLAFLTALEVLTPSQRAVLILRDVFDYSVKETAEAVALSTDNVKTTHLRARRAMKAYDLRRNPPTIDVKQRTRAALERFLGHLAAADVAGVQSMLAEEVATFSDGGGEFHAARTVVRGPDHVTRFYVGLGAKAGPPARVSWIEANGLPAVVLEFSQARPGWAPRLVLQCELDEAGRITRVYAILASRKLMAVGRRPTPLP